MIPSEIADCRYAVGATSNDREDPRVFETWVCISIRPGIRKRPLPLHDLCMWGGRKRSRRPHVVNAIAQHEDRASPWRFVVHRQDRDVADHQSGRRRRGPPRAIEADDSCHGERCAPQKLTANPHSRSVDDPPASTLVSPPGTSSSAISVGICASRSAMSARQDPSPLNYAAKLLAWETAPQQAQHVRRERRSPVVWSRMAD